MFKMMKKCHAIKGRTLGTRLYKVLLFAHVFERKIEKWCLTLVTIADHVEMKWNDWCFRPRFCTVKAILGQRQPGRIRGILSWIMPLAQDRSPDLLACSPARYHCTTDAPCHVETKISYGMKMWWHEWKESSQIKNKIQVNWGILVV